MRHQFDWSNGQKVGRWHRSTLLSKARNIPRIESLFSFLREHYLPLKGFLESAMSVRGTMLYPYKSVIGEMTACQQRSNEKPCLKNTERNSPFAYPRPRLCSFSWKRKVRKNMADHQDGMMKDHDQEDNSNWEDFAHSKSSDNSCDSGSQTQRLLGPLVPEFAGRLGFFKYCKMDLRNCNDCRYR